MRAIDALVDACAGQEDEDEGDWVGRLAGRWRLLFSTEAGLTALMGGGVPLVSAADVYQLVESGGRLKVSRCFFPRGPVLEDGADGCDCESSACSFVLEVACRVSSTRTNGFPIGIRQPLTLTTFDWFSAWLSWLPCFFAD